MTRVCMDDKRGKHELALRGMRARRKGLRHARAMRDEPATVCAWRLCKSNGNGIQVKKIINQWQ
jgi:hypothetical protein